MVPGPSSYPQRHHPRLAGYDYLTAGYSFVTVCTQHRLPLFGSVHAGSMRLSPGGEMVQEAWRDLLALHPGVDIDTDVALPDHVHAIVVLDDDPRRTLSLSDLMHRYKSLTTKRYAHGVRDHGWPRFAGRLWQEGFYDQVIRQDGELDAVRRSILENPLRWQLRRAASEQAGER
jgi:REP element-mobilizing transposase RayT